MRAIVATRAGGPEVLDLVEQPAPAPAEGEVLVAAEAVGVNFIDTYRRSGVYPVPFPHVPGTEGAGRIVAVGPRTDAVVGQPVAFAAGRGAYAEQVIVPVGELLPVPEGIGAATAAALALQGLTAHYLCRSTFVIQPGNTALVHAGAGGVGGLLTQLIRAHGGRVITTAGTPEKAELSRSYGADEVIVYSHFDDLATQLPPLVRRWADDGVDVVFDGVGRATFDASLASLARRGLLVLYGGASGQVPPFDLQRLNAAGSLYVTRPTLAHYVAGRDELIWRWSELTEAVLAGQLAVPIGAQYPLADAAEAHRALEGRRTTGKVLLIP